MPTDDGLIVRPAVRHRAVIIPASAVLLVVLIVVAVVREQQRWLTIVGAITVAAYLVLSVWAIKVERAGQWLLRLEDAGVASPGNRTVPWSEIQEVRVTPFVGTRFLNMTKDVMIAFVGADGRAMPNAGGPERAIVGRLGRRVRGAYGSNLLIFPAATDVTRDQVIEWIEAHDVATVVRKDVPRRDRRTP